MSRYAGLEIDRSSLRMAIFDGTPKKYHLVEFIEEELHAESAEERAEIIREILGGVLARKENHGMEVVTGIDARDVVLREISVNYTREDLIDKVIKYEAESYLHSQAIEDVIVEYLKCSERGDSSRLILCMAPKEVLARHLEEVQAAGIDPLTVELDATALATCFASTPLYDEGRTALLVELEPSYSRLVLIEEQRVMKIRSFWDRPRVRRDRLLGDGSTPSVTPTPDASSSSGQDSPAASGDQIEERFDQIERALSVIDQPTTGSDAPVVASDADLLCVVPDDQYDHIVDRGAAASPPGPDAGPAPLPAATGEAAAGTRMLMAAGSDDPMERIFTEIDRTFAAYALGGNIDLMVVTGSRAAQLDAVDRLAERYEIDVVPFDLGDSFPITWEGDREVLSSRGAVACGLGLRALGEGFTRFDLRKDDFRFERRFAQLMPSVMLTGLLLWVLAVVWSFGMYIQNSLTAKEADTLIQEERKMYAKFFQEQPEQEPSGGNYFQATNKKLAAIKGTGTKTRIKQYLNVTQILNDISKAIEQATVTGEDGKEKRVYPVFMEFDINPYKNKNATTKLVLKVKNLVEFDAVATVLAKNLEYFDLKKARDKPSGKSTTLEATYDLGLKLKYQK